MVQEAEEPGRVEPRPAAVLTRTTGPVVSPTSETVEIAPAPSASPPQDEPRRDAGAEDEVGLERYEVLGKLGEGAMGEIFLARERHLRRRVALKRFKLGHEGALARERFVAEAQVTAQLDHPGIVPVYALELAPGRAPAYSMKPIEGRSLAETIDLAAKRAAQGLTRREEDAQRDELLEAFLRVCEAVHFAHSRGVIHRDLKPENVMLGRFGEVYVVDWGLARLRAEEGASELVLGDGVDEPGAPEAPNPAADPASRTVAGLIKGTPLYMAPEQARGEPLGAAADVYALGLVLYELVYLRRGRPGETIEQVLEHARANRIDPPPRARDRSPELRAIVALATAGDPAARYATVAELGEDVRRFLRGEATRAYPDGLARRLRRALARHPQLALSLAFALIAWSAGTVVLGGHRERLARAQEQLRGATRERAAAHLASAVGERAQALGGELLRYEGLVTGLAATLGYALERGTLEAGPRYTSEAFTDPATAPPDLSPSPSYGKPVSPRWPLVVVPPGTPPALAAEDTALVAGLRGVLRAAVGTARQGVALPRDTAALDRAIVGHETPVEWLYAALERSGAMAVFPGTRPDWDETYDPRRRPWYRQAKAAFEREGRLRNWSSPYLDAMGRGLVVTCTEVVVGRGGELVGVCGLDLSVALLDGDALRLSELPGWRRSALLDGERRVLLDTDFAPHRTGSDGALELRPYPLAAALGEGPGGIAPEVAGPAGPVILAWARLHGLGWTLVVEVDPVAADLTAR